MNRRAAFRFIPELVLDFARVSELSRNPMLMYLESAMSTIHMAASVYEAVEEHMNTKRKEDAEQAIRRKYGRLADTRDSYYRDEELRKLDADFESVKAKVRDGLFRDEAVRSFVALLQTELSRVLEVFSNVETDSDFGEQSRIDELTRKALRDYKILLAVYIEEGSRNDEK